MKENTKEKSLIKVNENIFKKIKKYIKSLFRGELKKQEIEIAFQDEKIKNSENKKTFEQNIKIEINNDAMDNIKREIFIQEIESNQDLLNSLSNERLEKLSKYYEELINNLRNEVNNLKKKCN